MRQLKLLTFISIFFAKSSGIALIGGKPASSKEYTAIGSLKPKDSKAITCSATLIATDWIVTADHCRYGGSEENPQIYNATEVEFLLGAKSLSPIAKVKLKKWVSVPPTKDNQGNPIEIDLVFAQLEKPLNLSLTTIPVLTTPLIESLSEYYEIAGFGVTDTDGQGPLGLRKSAQVQITAVKGNAFDKIFSSKNGFESYLAEAFPSELPSLDRLYSAAELMALYTAHVWDPRGRETQPLSLPKEGWSDSCYGDSGGPLLKRTSRGLRLVGVIFSGFPGETLPCTPIGTKVVTFGPSIQKVMRDNKIPFM